MLKAIRDLYERAERWASRRPLAAGLVMALLAPLVSGTLKYFLIVVVVLIIFVESLAAYLLAVGLVVVFAVAHAVEARREASKAGLGRRWVFGYAVVVAFFRMVTPVGWLVGLRIARGAGVGGGWGEFGVPLLFAFVGTLIGILLAWGLQAVRPSPFGKSWWLIH
ncbi:MAG: hypothetical protein EXR64_01545 [Dehalococcoidia bacterium]|nr:hypothetical protein [Dehalococcoidia bacterium]